MTSFLSPKANPTVGENFAEPFLKFACNKLARSLVDLLFRQYWSKVGTKRNSLG
jgi:hypothetical protein